MSLLGQDLFLLLLEKNIHKNRIFVKQETNFHSNLKWLICKHFHNLTFEIHFSKYSLFFNLHIIIVIKKSATIITKI